MTANRTVFDIPLTWSRTRFEATRNKCRFARKLIEISINVQFEKQMRGVFCQNIEIEENINDINEHLLKYHDKLRVLDNMIELASQSLRIYFDRRMEHVRTIVNEHCLLIQQIIYEEAEHWKEIHAVMNQNLINPGDIRSRNNYPRTVQKSPGSNIQTIDEEEEEHISNLLNGKTLTPLVTQMIRRSRLQSKRLSSSSVNINIPIQSEKSLLRKQERFSIHILPLSTTRQPLEIVDTTFVVKPEEATLDGEMHDENDEPNGTYRAPVNHYHRSHLPETTFTHSHRNIPARLCFSPTILQDATVSPNDDELSSSDNEKPMKKILLPIDQNQTNIIKTREDNHRFGQTFLLDIIKTENTGDDQTEYIRPAIPDDDVLVIFETNPSSTHVPRTTNDNHSSKSDLPIQQKLITVQETVPTKSRTRVTTKTKSKPVIVSARKTRSATKDIAERAAAATAAVEKPIENKRKTRKRKQSKSIDHRAETSDDGNENSQTYSNSTTNNQRKTRRHKKSKTDHQQAETSDDEPSSNSNRLTNNKRKTQKQSKSKERDPSDNEHNKMTKRTKSKISTNDNEEKRTKIKKRKRKTRKTKKDDEEQISVSDQTKHYSTRSSSKRDHRPV